MKKCPKCGKEISRDEKFCEDCGAPLFFCPQCGESINKDDVFCEVCGAKLITEISKEEVEQQGLRTPHIKPNNNRNRNIVIAVIAVLCIVGGGYFGYRQMVIIPMEKAKIEIDRQKAESDKQAETIKNEAIKGNESNKTNNGDSKVGNKTSKKDAVNRGVVMDTDPNGLNVRSGPGTSYPIVSALAYGTVVEIKDANGDWYHINFEGTLGWVSGNLIQIMERIQRDGHINSADSNIRGGPSDDSHLLGVFAKNEKVYVVGHVNGWYNVNRSNGSNCWVYDGYISF